MVNMSKRLPSKKPIKISFNEFPEESEVNFNWDVNFSSDEDIFLKGKSEVLWSRSGDLFDSLDSYQSFSDITERTLSSCSWHNDEFDMKSSYKVNTSLEAIDDALYEKTKPPTLNDTLYQECCDWAEKFPYFRIKGQQIASSEADNFISFSSSSINANELSARNSSASLHLEGKKLTIHSASKNRGMLVNNFIDNGTAICLEKNIKDEDVDEEYFALHKCDQSSDNLEVPIIDESEAHLTFKSIQEKIIDKLTSEMWPSVLAFLENIDDKSKNNVNNDLQLPPITIANVQKTPHYLKRPNTEGSNVLVTAFPKLDSILTVSPKILQKRDVTRPNSEMSVTTRMSSKSLKSVYPHSNSVHINSEFSQVQSTKSDQGTEGLNLVLPALEEDFQDSSNVLRGFHIEPHSRNSANKTNHPSRKEVLSRENDCFLPPITDKNYLPSDLKLTKNLFTYYGSPVRPNRNKYTSSAKYKKPNSRPNTSISKKSLLNNEISQLPVNSELFISARGMSKSSSNFHTENNLDATVDNGEIQKESQEKSVMLFPIVKSLTPYEDKNNSAKKGILHTFLRGKKR